jgi:large subunit ribosomal protein L19e
MKLNKKKELARRTLNVGKSRIIFLESRLDEIKEAITKQDIRDLKKEGAIVVKEIKGKRKVRKKRKRSVGNIKKKVKTRKKDYVIMTRRLRNYLSELKKAGKISREDEKELRKKIRNKAFRSKAHLKEQLGGLKK